MSLAPDTPKNIEKIIASDAVVLFMKGDRHRPECGFSGRVIEVLDMLLPFYTTVNVLENPLIREGVKEFSNWPTIPQLYINQVFIGGCDIAEKLYQTGELFTLLGQEKPPPYKPHFSITDAAVKQMKSLCLQQGKEANLRLQISAAFAYDLLFDEPAKNDIQIEQDGFFILLDRLSASRAEAITIDYLTDEEGVGFHIENPNAPTLVKQISVQDLKNKLDLGEAIHLFDVRTQAEWDESHISAARLLANVPSSEIESLDKNESIVFHCRSGGRSARIAEKFRFLGFKNVYNLSGGITAWSAHFTTISSPSI